MEKNLNLLLTTEDGSFNLNVVGFCGISSIPRKVIVIGTITKGEIKVGDPVIIGNNFGEDIPCFVKRIEREHRFISYAVRNEPIGLSLSNISIKDLRKLNLS